MSGGVGFHVPRDGAGWSGQDEGPGSGWGESGQGGAAGQDELGVRGVGLEVQADPAAGAGQGRGDGEDAVEFRHAT